MSLSAQTSALWAGFQASAPPPVFNAIKGAIDDFAPTFSPDIKVGDTLPEFRMPDALGHEVTSTALLARGPLLISFYRGEWCPFCNLELRALQAHLPAFQAQGVTLVAISPELPDQSLTTTQKLSLEFTVLSDKGNAYAKQLGILFQQPDELRPVFKSFGNDLVARNGDDSFALPVPATLLVDRGAVVRNLFVDPDHSKRLEPETALRWIEAL